MTDLDHWGVVETLDLSGRRLRRLRRLCAAEAPHADPDAGWPREALLITVVRDKHGDGHAVLTVKTDKGEFILDNQIDEILLWSDTGYRFVKRQSQIDPNVWIALGEPRARRRPRPRADGQHQQKEFATPVTSPPLPVPRPGSRAAGSPPRAGRTFLGCARRQRFASASLSHHRA